MKMTTQSAHAQYLVREIACKQGAVRAVRFNGIHFSNFHDIIVLALISFSYLFHVVEMPTVDGDYCLTCGSDKSLKLWNPYRGALLKSYTGHGFDVLDAHSSCDSRYTKQQFNFL